MLIKQKEKEEGIAMQEGFNELLYWTSRKLSLFILQNEISWLSLLENVLYIIDHEKITNK